MNARMMLYACAVCAAFLAIAFALQGTSGAYRVLPSVTTSHTIATSTARAALALPDTYPVVKVVDGDTIDILMNEKTVRVRLIGLDTPEIVDPRKPVQCFAKEASDKAKEILTGQSVRIETDPSQDTYDKYGRLLAYVFLPAQVGLQDETNFNEYMIAEGYGHEYTYNLPYKYQTAFKAAEKAAREHEKGLWAPDTCAGNTKQAAQNTM